MAHPNGIQNLHAASRRSNEVLRPKLRKDPRYHFSDRTDAVREILLIHERGKLTARSRARRGEVEEMPRDSLADRRERVPCELLENVVQPVNRLFRECPGQRRIVVRGSSDAIDVEEECGAGRNGLGKNRCGSANERRHAQQITSAYIAHCDLAAVTHNHVDTQQPLENDSQSFSVSFRVHGFARRKLDNASSVDQRLNGSNR